MSLIFFLPNSSIVTKVRDKYVPNHIFSWVHVIVFGKAAVSQHLSAIRTLPGLHSTLIVLSRNPVLLLFWRCERVLGQVLGLWSRGWVQLRQPGCILSPDAVLQLQQCKCKWVPLSTLDSDLVTLSVRRRREGIQVAMPASSSEYAVYTGFCDAQRYPSVATSTSSTTIWHFLIQGELTLTRESHQEFEIWTPNS